MVTQDQFAQLFVTVSQLSKKVDQECAARQALETMVKKLEKQLEEERHARALLLKSVK